MQVEVCNVPALADDGERSLTLSVVIPTYGREEVLLNSIAELLQLASTTKGFKELILVDQTAQHLPETERQLQAWSCKGPLRWLRATELNLTLAMNRGLMEACGDVVLFTDDDITPGADMLSAHLTAYRENPDLWAVVGQVLQPGEEPEKLAYQPRGGALMRFMDFPFRRTEGTLIENAMAGNLSVIKAKALMVGGFDENFPPPVAARFETEFAKRLVASGGLIWFEPKASLRHLRAPSGGTRSNGSHLSSALPCFSVGDYYFALRRGQGWEKWAYILKKPFREVRTKFHLKHPWWIPVKLIGELRAFVQAVRANSSGPKLLESTNPTGPYLP